MLIAEKIKILRRQKRITQQQLASHIGVGRNTITQYEAGRIVPPVQNIKKLASYFSVSPDFLVNNEQNISEINLASVKKETFGDVYIDSVMALTVRKVTDYFILKQGSLFYSENKDCLYKLIESMIYLNVKAIKSGEKAVFFLQDDDNEVIKLVNEQIKGLAKQLVGMERLQRLMDIK